MQSGIGLTTRNWEIHNFGSIVELESCNIEISKLQKTSNRLFEKDGFISYSNSLIVSNVPNPCQFNNLCMLMFLSISSHCKKSV